MDMNFVVLGLAVVTFLLALKFAFKPTPLLPGPITWEVLEEGLLQEKYYVETAEASGVLKVLKFWDAEGMCMLCICFRDSARRNGQVIGAYARDVTSPLVRAKDRAIIFEMKGERVTLYPASTVPLRLWPFFVRLRAVGAQFNQKRLGLGRT